MASPPRGAASDEGDGWSSPDPDHGDPLDSSLWLCECCQRLVPMLFRAYPLVAEIMVCTACAGRLAALERQVRTDEASQCTRIRQVARGNHADPGFRDVPEWLLQQRKEPRCLVRPPWFCFPPPPKTQPQPQRTLVAQRAEQSGCHSRSSIQQAMLASRVQLAILVFARHQLLA